MSRACPIATPRTVGKLRIVDVVVQLNHGDARLEVALDCVVAGMIGVRAPELAAGAVQHRDAFKRQHHDHRSGSGVERLTFRRVLGTDKLNEIFVSLGLIYVFESIAILLWGVNSKQVVSPFYGLSLSFQGVSITYDRIIAVFVVIATLAAFGVLMKKTKIGLAMRATSQRNTTAMLMGINVEKIYMLTFAIGAALAAVAGGLYGIIFSFDYQVGAMPTIIAFAIIIMGGLGSIKGAIVGGLLYGITEQLATLFFGGIWGSAVAFALLIVVLVLRPNGIFGEKGD